MRLAIPIAPVQRVWYKEGGGTPPWIWNRTTRVGKNYGGMLRKHASTHGKYVRRHQTHRREHEKLCLCVYLHGNCGQRRGRLSTVERA